MKDNDTASFIVSLTAIIFTVGFIPLLVFIIFPFLNGLSAEKRFEKYINKQCLLGNEVAITIKREKIRFYDACDYKLVRAAIDGNENAIRALKLDPESRKKGFY